MSRAPEDEKPLLAVNPAALTTPGRKAGGIRDEGGKAVYTPVTLGKKLGDWVEVTSGLKTGEKVA